MTALYTKPGVRSQLRQCDLGVGQGEGLRDGDDGVVLHAGVARLVPQVLRVRLVTLHVPTLAVGQIPVFY